MVKSFHLPDLGEGIHEAEVLAVHVEKGQEVREGEVILEVETDKAAVEIPSPFNGRIVEVLVHVGETVRVGVAMLTFAGSGENDAKTGDGSRVQGIAAKEEKTSQGTGATAGRLVVPASPATRRLARELGVDLQQIRPTDPGGVVRAEDVRAVAAGQANREDVPAREAGAAQAESARAQEEAPDESLPDFSRWGPVERIPFRSIRRATAARMVDSWRRIPHVTCQDTADVSALEAFRQRHRQEIAAAGGRLTMTVFALKAAVTALKNYPQFNASLDSANQEIVIKRYFHIGVAVDTDHGLVVPVIRDVDRKSIKELSIELQEKVVGTRNRTIAREELGGGSFTLTNAGAMGGGFFTPIINYPEVAIMGLGQAKMQPAVVKDEEGRAVIRPRLLMPVVLCFDHRVADGADAVRFLRQLVDAMEDPDELLITMV